MRFLRRTDVTEGRVLDLGRDGGRAVGGTQGTGDEARDGGVLAHGLSRALLGELGGGLVHLVGQGLETVVGLRDRRRVERVRLDDVRSGIKVPLCCVVLRGYVAHQAGTVMSDEPSATKK